jgi:hypothetical protein
MCTQSTTYSYYAKCVQFHYYYYKEPIFVMLIHLLESSIIDCSEILDKSLDHEQGSGQIWWMQARLKPLSDRKFVVNGCDHQKGGGWGEGMCVK